MSQLIARLQAYEAKIRTLERLNAKLTEPIPRVRRVIEKNAEGLWLCIRCKEWKLHKARYMCRTCYARWYRLNKRDKELGSMVEPWMRDKLHKVTPIGKSADIVDNESRKTT